MPDAADGCGMNQFRSGSCTAGGEAVRCRLAAASCSSSSAAAATRASSAPMPLCALALLPLLPGRRAVGAASASGLPLPPSKIDSCRLVVARGM